MTIIGSQKFKVNDSHVLKIVDSIGKLEHKVIMFKKPLNRVLIKRSPFTEKGKTWVRVRTGDVGKDGLTKTTIDYKSVEGFGSGANRVRTEIPKELPVSDYHNAIQFLKSMGAEISSEQQNTRTKIVCTYEKHEFILCFDVWPWLEDIMFIKIEPTEKQGYYFLNDFIDFLELKESDDEVINIRTIRNGIDGVYEKKYGFYLSEVCLVRFGLNPPRRRKDDNSMFVEQNGRRFNHITK